MIVLCVTGSVAAGESVKLAREFKRQGIDVKCFMSEAACKIIHPNSMEFATGSEVITELTGNIEHVKELLTRHVERQRQRLPSILLERALHARNSC